MIRLHIIRELSSLQSSLKLPTSLFELRRDKTPRQVAHNWPPARNAYAPEGIMEYWNDGIMKQGVYGK